MKGLEGFENESNTRFPPSPFSPAPFCLLSRSGLQGQAPENVDTVYNSSKSKFFPRANFQA